MPRRELNSPEQIENWLVELGTQLPNPGELTLIGSGGLLWHAFQRGIQVPLPENSMDVDPVTDSEDVARICYAAIIGSEFEAVHGWHVNLMPESVLLELPSDWQFRAAKKRYDKLNAIVPSPIDLIVPKRKRNEPRDRAHERWAKEIGLI